MMKNSKIIFLGLIIPMIAGFYFKNLPVKSTIINSEFIQETTINKAAMNDKSMKLGAFSMSLSVKDLKVSKAFYENLGFTVLGGDMEKNYLIMKNENALIGLFQGMFEGNILTFNPGWDENGQNIESFDDIRTIQKNLQSSGIKIDNEIKEETSGPASIVISDPDGNMILLDQHR